MVCFVLVNGKRQESDVYAKVARNLELHNLSAVTVHKFMRLENGRAIEDVGADETSLVKQTLT